MESRHSGELFPLFAVRFGISKTIPMNGDARCIKYSFPAFAGFNPCRHEMVILHASSQALLSFWCLLFSLILFMVMEYLTQILVAILSKQKSSEIGFCGIVKKVSVLFLVAMGNVIDTLIIQNGSMIRTIVLLFYLSHEGITILENVEKLDLPIPQKCMEISLYTVSAVLFLKFLSFFLLWGQSFVSGAIGRDAPLEIKIQFCQFVVKKDRVTLLFVSYLEFSDANYIRNLYRFCVIYSV